MQGEARLHARGRRPAERRAQASLRCVAAPPSRRPQAPSFTKRCRVKGEKPRQDAGHILNILSGSCFPARLITYSCMSLTAWCRMCNVIRKLEPAAGHHPCQAKTTGSSEAGLSSLEKDQDPVSLSSRKIVPPQASICLSMPAGVDIKHPQLKLEASAELRPTWACFESVALFGCFEGEPKESHPL